MHVFQLPHLWPWMLVFLLQFILLRPSHAAHHGSTIIDQHKRMLVPQQKQSSHEQVTISTDAAANGEKSTGVRGSLLLEEIDRWENKRHPQKDARQQQLQKSSQSKQQLDSRLVRNKEKSRLRQPTTDGSGLITHHVGADVLDDTWRLNPTDSVMYGQPVSVQKSATWYFDRFRNFAKITPSIVGGDDANSRDAPYFVMLLTWNETASSWVYMGCGGALISSQHVLTAAHCVSDRSTSSTKDAVYIHAYQPFAGNPGVPFHFSPVQSYTVHPSFDRATDENDIAVIKFNISVNAQFFPPVPLAEPWLPVEDGSLVQVFGFGHTSESSTTTTQTLQVADLPFVSTVLCSKYYPRNYILDDMICGGNLTDGGVDACQGDSGGPMVYQYDSTTYLVGVVSWGRGCGRANQPGVYSSLSYHHDWVQDTVCSSLDDNADVDDDSVPWIFNLCRDWSSSISTKNRSSGLSPASVDSTTDSCQLKAIGQSCLYGGQCCSGVCGLHLDDNGNTIANNYQCLTNDTVQKGGTRRRRRHQQ